MRTDNERIENLFEEGGPCARLYECIYDEELKLLEKLGTGESGELERILGYKDDICELVSLRMFDYGAEFSK